jgi:hypothetical protein
MSQRWRPLQRVMLSPGKIGGKSQAALVLVQFEHKMITRKSLRKPQCPAHDGLSVAVDDGRHSVESD